MFIVNINSALLLWIILLENILVLVAMCYIVQENFFFFEIAFKPKWSMILPVPEKKKGVLTIYPQNI